jgi:hypothetical protein
MIKRERSSFRVFFSFGDSVIVSSFDIRISDFPLRSSAVVDFHQAHASAVVQSGEQRGVSAWR